MNKEIFQVRLKKTLLYDHPIIWLIYESKDSELEQSNWGIEIRLYLHKSREQNKIMIADLHVNVK